MADEAPPQERLEGQVLRETVHVEPRAAVPSVGLFQPFFALSEADYLRLKSPDTLLYGIGTGVTTFGLSYALPTLVPLVLNFLRPTNTNVSFPDLFVGLGVMVLGLICGLIAHLRSGERRRVFKRIEQHFRENPGRPEVRVEEV